MTAPSEPKKRTLTARRRKAAAEKPAAARRRRSANKRAPDPEGTAARSLDSDHGSPARRESGRQVEQFAILLLALICALIGFAVHFLWIPAVVLMAVALGLAAAELRADRRRGVIPEVVAEAKNVAADITSREDHEPESSLDHG